MLIELKTKKLTPEAAGHLNMYLNYYAAEVNDHDDNLPIGINRNGQGTLVCWATGKKKDYAEYWRSREEMRDLLTAKANVDRLMGYGEEPQNEIIIEVDIFLKKSVRCNISRTFACYTICKKQRKCGYEADFNCRGRQFFE